MKRVLMLAYDFPPVNKSGSARPFYFARHLYSFGYCATVLTRKRSDIDPSDAELFQLNDDRVSVVRLDVGDNDNFTEWLRNKIRVSDSACRAVLGVGLADALNWRVRGYLPGLREYVHWVRPCVQAGTLLRRATPFSVVWATAPPWETLIAGYRLSQFVDCPLVVDLRDPWSCGKEASRAANETTLRRITGGRNGAAHNVRRAFFTCLRRRWNRKWESRILTEAAAIVTTSPLTTAEYTHRIPGIARKCHTITNGFSSEPCSSDRDVPRNRFLLRFLGKTDSNYRNPEAVLAGMRLACANSELRSEIVLELIGNGQLHEQTVSDYGLSDVVRIIEQVPYRTSLAMMRGADVLLLLQTFSGRGSDVISGKAYEYLAAGKPILACVPEDGGDAWLVRETQSGLVVRWDDPEGIARDLTDLWSRWRHGHLAALLSRKDIERFSRRSLTGDLAHVFDAITRS